MRMREANVTTCEHCGAEAMDEQGQCHNCGWSAANDDGEPSLGETRAADVAPAGAPATHATGSPQAYPDRTVDLPRYGATSRPTVASGRPANAGTPSLTGGPATRFCGACGARITGTEAFCGQCGTPVGGASDPSYGTVLSPAPHTPTGYQPGASSGWANVQGDAPTEAIIAPPPPSVRGLPSNPYSQVSYGSRVGTAPPQTPAPASSSRTGRIVFGILCIVGSLISAAAAVILALQK